MTKSNSLITLAHEFIRRKIKIGAITIDATLGNGHDTLFLAQSVGHFGLVYGFDIQQQALDNTHQRLQEANSLDQVRLILDSHAKLLQYIDRNHHAQISAAMFNLGYLPGSDKTIQTHSASTLEGLNAALQLLASHGIVTILVYPGHQDGEKELHAVEQWCLQLDKGSYQITLHLSKVASNLAPQLFIIEKID